MNFLQLALAQAFVGLNIVLAKLLSNSLGVWVLLEIRFLCGLGVLVLLHSLLRKPLMLRQAFQKNKIVLIIGSLCAGLLFNFFLILGLRSTTATNAGIVSSTIPIVIMLLSFLFLKERLSVQKITSVVFVVVGLVLLSIQHQSHAGAEKSTLLGFVLIFIAVFAESCFTILAKGNQESFELTPMQRASFTNLYNVIFILPFCLMELPYQNFSHFHWQQMALAFLYGVSGGMGFFVLWYSGIRKTLASTGALFTAVMPVSALMFAFFVLKEPVSLIELFSMLLVIFAIIIGSVQPRWRVRQNFIQS